MLGYGKNFSMREATKYLWDSWTMRSRFLIMFLLKEIERFAMDSNNHFSATCAVREHRLSKCQLS